MNIKTYRARSMQDALALVRRELGPDAAVLHTRQVRSGGLFRWLPTARRVEVTASSGVRVPSRLPAKTMAGHAAPVPRSETSTPPAHLDLDYRAQFRDQVKEQSGNTRSMIERLCTGGPQTTQHDLPEALFEVFTDMIEADVDQDVARELIERVRHDIRPEELGDSLRIRAQIARIIEDEITVTGAIRTTPGKRRLVALVGPTGVGKTTTIAKLAANYRLREKCRVGLITVDTYRIAAVQQLRTYADIIDLPMEVVATPREMREAATRLAELDLILLDTAGRSPRDDVKIQELKSMLGEADADEVHLVLSSVAGAKGLASTAEKFRGVGTTSLILTKLDEATSLGNLLPLVRSCKLPLSYLTNGQNVPDDISVANAQQLAKMVLGTES